MNPNKIAEVENNFKFHAPKDEEQIKKYEQMREKLKETAKYVLENTPASREQSVALTKLEEAMFWANAAIARNEQI